MITYYGGKQRLAPSIVERMPPHRVYVEPYCGGLAVLFSKAPAHLEVINDKDERLIRVYRMLREDETARDLIGRLALTPYSRAEHRHARETLKAADAPEIALAWAAVVDIAQGINCRFGSGWRCSTEAQGSVVQPRTWATQLERLIAGVERLRHVEIECRDALDVIRRYDSPETVTYCDPPYPGSDQGHYRGFTLEHFLELWRLLSTLEGTAMVSCYSGTVPPELTAGWVCHQQQVTISSNRHTMRGGARTEQLWIRSPHGQASLFDVVREQSEIEVLP